MLYENEKYNIIIVNINSSLILSTCASIMHAIINFTHLIYFLCGYIVFNLFK